MRLGGIALYRIGAGVSMIVAPLFWLASAVLGPGHEDSRHLADSLPHIAADPDRFLAFVLLGLLSHLVLIPAVVGVAHLVTGQRSRIAFLGAALVTLGVFCLAVVEGVQLVQHQMVGPAADREQMIALLDRVEAGAGARIVFGVMLVGLFPGWVALSIGVLGARVVPRPVPASIIAALVLSLVGQDVLSRLALLVGLGSLGVVVLRMGDEAWLTGERRAGPRGSE
jgi:hypothetical protein